MIAKIKEFIKNININIHIFSARDKKKTVAIFCIAAVFVLFLIGFLIGRLAFSKEYTLNNLENALNKKNITKLTDTAGLNLMTGQEEMNLSLLLIIFQMNHVLIRLSPI